MPFNNNWFGGIYKSQLVKPIFIADLNINGDNSPPSSFFRITDSDERRITDDGESRITDI